MKRLFFVVFAAIMLAFVTCALMAHGSPLAAAPTLTPTEQIALHSVSLESQEIQQRSAMLAREINAIEADIAKTHPGFHLDPAEPLSGRLVADTPAAPVKK